MQTAKEYLYKYLEENDSQTKIMLEDMFPQEEGGICQFYKDGEVKYYYEVCGYEIVFYKSTKRAQYRTKVEDNDDRKENDFFIELLQIILDAKEKMLNTFYLSIQTNNA